MTDIPDHPMIRTTEAKGYPKDPEYPTCPVCGQGCDKVYQDLPTGTILGCDCCIEEKDAWETEACFPEKRKE